MIRSATLTSIFLLFFSLTYSQEERKAKLLIGIVVDQMRYDYLEKFGPYFSKNGFNKLHSEGYSFSNMNYNYKPTYTGPGHTSIFTGATPSKHGIVGNNWYSREEINNVYCVKLSTDTTSILSPKRMLTESIADVIKSTSSNKVYGIALKDRGAILPAGHSANGAYWFSSQSGQWESSKYYPDQNPSFLQEFNEIDFKSEALKKDWSLESTLVGKKIDWFDDGDPLELQKFNHDLESEFDKRSWDLLKAIPYGNQMTAELAMKLIESEGLGNDEALDFISLSFSATDYVGHKYGVESPEVADTYIQLDRTLAVFIDFLDKEVGEDEYLLFLSSDHGAGFSRRYLSDKNKANGKLNLKEIKNKLERLLDKKFGEHDWVQSMYNLNVYLNHDLNVLPDLLEFDSVLNYTSKYLSTIEGIDQVIVPSKYNGVNNLSQIIQMTMNGYLEQRSGDIILIEATNWTTYSDEGSTHGSPYTYDTHVPFFIYGHGVKNGLSEQPCSIIDIAPTICNLLKISSPKNAEGSVIIEFNQN